MNLQLLIAGLTEDLRLLLISSELEKVHLVGLFRLRSENSADRLNTEKKNITELEDHLKKLMPGKFTYWPKSHCIIKNVNWMRP